MSIDKETYEYLKELNAQHEERLVMGGEQRFIRKERMGKVKINKKTGQLQQVNEESNTMYGAILVKKYAGLLAYYLQEWVDEYESNGRQSGRVPDVILLLRTLDIQVISWITLTTVVDHISRLPKLAALAIHVAKRIEDQARFWLFEKTEPEYMQSLVEDWKRRNIASYHHKRAALLHVSNKKGIQWTPWSVETQTRLGVTLIESLINVSSEWTEDGKRVMFSGLIERSIETNSDSFNSKDENHSVYYVRATESTLEAIKECVTQNAQLSPMHMPVLCPPKDWSNAFDGGYHTYGMQSATQLVKTRSVFERQYLKRYFPGVDGMPDVYKSINWMQSIPYRVNRTMYEQFSREIMRGDGIGVPSVLPYEVSDCPIGQLKREDYQSTAEWKTARTELMESLTDRERKEFGEWLEDSREVYTREAKRKSEWISVYSTERAAKEMLDAEQFWYVWTMDTRSRAYTCCTTLSFQGNKYGKAILEYSEPAPVGTGLKDIQVYMAGLWGLDKGTKKARIAWTEYNAENIYQVWKDTDATRDWWGQADEPWEFLACCVHFGDIIKAHSQGMDVSGMTTRGRVHFDGKCNSTQHFSMMLRDTVGAKQVNLLPLPGEDSEPEDIYGIAASRLLKKMHDLTVSTDQVDAKYAYNMLAFGIDRGLLKKTTMTYTYGGTVRGCKKHLLEYLPKEDKGNNLTEWFDSEGTKHGGARRTANWLHTHMYQAVAETMESVTQGMQFLKKVGWAVGQYADRAMVFHTPLGFPVLHFSELQTHKRVEVRLKGTVIIPQVHSGSGKCNPWKMRDKLPPNFVHSMDASHMHRVASLCADAGIPLTTIHDSYGCRPCHAGMVKQFIIKEFVKLYERDVLRDFVDEQLLHNPEIADKFPDVDECCTYGDLDINEVLKADYAFL